MILKNKLIIELERLWHRLLGLPRADVQFHQIKQQPDAETLQFQMTFNDRPTGWLSVRIIGDGTAEHSFDCSPAFLPCARLVAKRLCRMSKLEYKEK